MINFLEYKRKQLGLNHSEFADYLGISRVTWWQTRVKKNPPSAKIILAVINRFPDYWMYRNNKMERRFTPIKKLINLFKGVKNG